MLSEIRNFRLADLGDLRPVLCVKCFGNGGFRGCGFRDCGFRGCGFRGCGFRDCGFRDCGFRDADFAACRGACG
ncbi:MAG: hypothetical protein E7029_10145 [Planctomycetaceae bacterium]|nr:hypothetical protein [Planctomycetaceae bacterium]